MQPLLHLNWNITYRCPLDCAHCYSRAKADELDELPLDGKLLLADRIADAGIFSVNLGGGEPIFSCDTAPVIERLSQRRVWTSLCTSGWGVRDSEVERMASSGLRSAFISLDDDRPAEHDSLRRRAGCHGAATEAISLFLKLGIETSVSTVVTRRNVGRLRQIASFAEGLGATAIEFKRLKPQGNARDLDDLLLSPDDEALLFDTVPALKSTLGIRVTLIYGMQRVEGVDEGCPCGKSILTILSDGTVAPCVYNPEPLGNALSDDILAIWASSPALEAFRERGTCAGLHLDLPSKH